MNLEQLADYHEVLTPDIAGAHAEACATSLVDAGHASGVHLDVEEGHQVKHVVEVTWSRTVGDRQFKAHNDQKRRTEDASVALALGVVHTLLGFRGIEKSPTKDRIDYYLSSDPGDDHLIFNHGPRLEVSGIFQPNKHNSVKKRVRDKLDRLNRPGGPGHDGNTLIFVVEYATPYSMLVRA